MKVRRLVGLFIAVIFFMTTVVALATGDSYVVIKDNEGVCKVIKAPEKKPTPNTIAGPFDTREDAEKAKERMCP